MNYSKYLVYWCHAEEIHLKPVFIYFYPAMNAQIRQHRERKAILVLNIFLGWTFLGWIAALVWSFTSQVEQHKT